MNAQYGAFDTETLTAVIGFSAGGPVSLFKKEEKRLYATCELAVYPEQVESSEGLKYEFFSEGRFSGT